MKFFNKSAWMVLPVTYAIGLSLVDDLAAADDNFRVLSWNISDDAFVESTRWLASIVRYLR